MFSCLLCCFQQQIINTSLREVNEMNDETVQKKIIQEENENRNLTNKKIKRFRNKFGMTKTNGHAELVSASLLIRFQNYLGLLLHLPFTK